MTIIKTIAQHPACAEFWLRELHAQIPVWRPIETAPKDGMRILLRSRSGNIADGSWSALRGTWDWPHMMLTPAYWMPLPEPPHSAKKRLVRFPLQI
ncbi:hypothetical protein [Comamonas thiooxydans]|uniref:hypothetical protein n=1 Tax=Comamonas thiooxydans TaxID=363952 RepID=UPI003D091051